MVIVSTIASARSLGILNSKEFQWVYLGKDINRRETVAAILGVQRRLRLGDRLHSIADKLRQPFLDFIANLGKAQTDQVGWWSSSCSWKNSTASDFFLLVCYEHLVGQLLQERKNKQETLIIVVEDGWLFRQLRDCFGSDQQIRFRQAESLWPSCARSFFMGWAARAVWTVRLLLSSLKQRWFSGWRARGEVCDARIGFYSFPQARCSAGTDGWRDYCLGDLDGILEKVGYSICRFSPPCTIGYEKALAGRRRYFVPLILYIPLFQIVTAAFALWRARLPKAPEIDGQPVRWLLLRERWLDRWRSSYLMHRLFFIGFTRFLSAHQLGLIAYPYENQPWERLLVMAAQTHGVRTVAYQHGAGLARFMLSYFHGAGEAAWAPLPDVIVTSAPYSRDLLLQGGAPPEQLVIGGSLRYRGLSVEPKAAVSTPRAGMCVLIALSVEPTLCMHLLHALKTAFPDGGRADGLEFVIKAHPECPVKEEWLEWPATIASGSFRDTASLCPIAIYSGTSAGMEALALGCRVIRYKSELFFNMDRAEFMTADFGVVDCGDYDLREKLLSVMKSLDDQPLTIRKRNELRDLMYAQVDEKAWMEVVDGLCQRTERGTH
ncbi:MAG: hypothetical protein FJ245_13560 [Nitrospira sp.]|nr:hypothetical protein [Nitrospira sp.]